MVEALAFGLLTVVLVVAAVSDVRCGLVHNWLTYPAMVGGLLFWFLAGLIRGGATGAAHELFAASIGLTAGLVPMAIIFAAGGLGGGDVKLMGAVGAMSSSWQCVLATAVYALIIAAGMAIFVMVRKRLVRQTLSRIIGAALAVGARARIDFSADSPRIPFGLALAIGGLIAAGELLLRLEVPWAWLSP